MVESRSSEASVRPEIIAVKLNRTVHAVKARLLQDRTSAKMV